MDRTERLKLRVKAYELYKKDMVDKTEIVKYGTFLDAEYQVNWYMELLFADEELIKAYHKDLSLQSESFEAIISRKVNATEGMFRIMYPTKKEQCNRKVVLEEVQYQVEVCEGFLKSVPEAKIKEWLQLRNAIQVGQKAHTHKMSKFNYAS